MTRHPHMRHVVYPDVFQHFVYLRKTFQLRKKKNSSRGDGMADTVGRLPMIALNPHTAGLYYLRILPYRVRGPTCFQDIRRVGNASMDIYLAACIAHDMIDNDQELNSVMEEAASFAFGSTVREVFANMLMFVLGGEHLQFWERHKRVLCEDLMHKAGVNEPGERIVNQVLLELKDHVKRHGFTLSEKFVLPEYDAVHVQPRMPRAIQHETEHNIPQLQADIAEIEYRLNDEQRVVVNTVMDNVEQALGKMIAVDASGGTGKTSTLSHILRKVRAQGKVALQQLQVALRLPFCLK